MIIPTLMCRAGKGKSALFEQTRQSLAAGTPLIVADSASPGSDKLPYMFTITINMVTITINMVTINMVTINMVTINVEIPLIVADSASPGS